MKRSVWQYSILSLLLLMVFGLVLPGCGGSGSSGLNSVSGTVTYNGTPLATGDIALMPIGGTQSATGKIEDGKFSLSTFVPGDGCPTGNYQVSITSWTTPPGMGTEGVPAIPVKYHNPTTSGLTANITGNTSDLKFELTP